MPLPKTMRIELVKLADGDRLLRLTDHASGLCLEKRLDPRQPVLPQKVRLRHAFAAALARELTPSLS